MRRYSLYLESGPRRQTTMVHVIDLLGCIARGATTEEAIDATPEAIRAYLSFLHRHGEAAKPKEPADLAVAQHVMEGSWLGYGDPTSGFRPDFEPLTIKDQKTYLKHFNWLHSDMLKLLTKVSRKQLVAEPRKGRSIHHVLQHVSEAQGYYLRYLVGKVDELADALKTVRQDPVEILPALTRVWQISSDRMEALTSAEREKHVPHGQVTWTARRAFRRMLEHKWEHLLEVGERLGKPL